MEKIDARTFEASNIDVVNYFLVTNSFEHNSCCNLTVIEL